MRFSVIRDGTRNAQAPWETLGRGYLDATGQKMRFFHGRGNCTCMFVFPISCILPSDLWSRQYILQQTFEHRAGETTSLVYDYVVRIHHHHVVFVDSFVTIDVNDNPMAPLAFWYAVSGRAEIQDLFHAESAIYSCKADGASVPLYM